MSNSQSNTNAKSVANTEKTISKDAVAKNGTQKEKSKGISIREKLIEKKHNFDKFSRPLLKVETAKNAIQYLAKQDALLDEQSYLGDVLSKLEVIEEKLALEAEKYV